MTPLTQRFIEDMQLRGLAPNTQRSYIHYVADYAKFYNTSPEKLDLEAVRQYELYLLNERKLSPESINAFVAAVQFLYLDTLEMPWGKECFPRVRRAHKLPVVLSPEEVARFFEYVPSLRYRAALMAWYGAGLRIFRSRFAQSERYRLQTQTDPRRTRQRSQRSICDALRQAAGCAPLLLPRCPASRRVDVSFLA